MMAVPRDSVSSSPRSPKMARVGMVYSSRREVPITIMFDMTAFRLPSASMTEPA